jgi:hypothetical protein
VNYEPAPVPLDDKALREYLSRELRRLAGVLRAGTATVAYLTSSVTASLSDAVSANWKISGNVALLSTSNTITLTGIADTTPNRVRTFINIGTGVVVFKSAGTESSASHRFALPADWQLSANAVASFWYDARAFRHRGLSRT